MNSILKKYKSYITLEQGLSNNTREAYLHDVEKLFTYFEDEKIDFLKVELEHFHSFAAALMDVGIGERSIARILSGVRSFYKFLVLDGYLEQDPTELLESPKIGKHLPEVLSVEEIDAIEGVIDVSTPEGQRDRAAIEMLYSCGLRVSELCNLLLSDLFLDEGFLRVTGKGNKQRLVPISERAIRELKSWFAFRNSINIKPGEENYVFISAARKKHLSRPTPSDTVLPPTCWRAEPICAPFRPCWDTKASVQPKSIPTLIAAFFGIIFCNTFREIRRIDFSFSTIHHAKLYLYILFSFFILRKRKESYVDDNCLWKLWISFLYKIWKLCNPQRKLTFPRRYPHLKTNYKYLFLNTYNPFSKEFYTVCG